MNKNIFCIFLLILLGVAIQIFFRNHKASKELLVDAAEVEPYKEIEYIIQEF